MLSARAFGISMAAGLVIGSGGGFALDIIAIAVVFSVGTMALVAAYLRRSHRQAEADS